MIKRQYALLDSTAKVFLNAFTAQNDGDAIRLFTTWVNDPDKNNMVGQYPEQFTLFYMGDFDDQLGIWKQGDGNTQVITGLSVKNEEEKKFTVNELITMLEHKLDQRNRLPSADNDTVVDISDRHQVGEK